MRSTKSPPKGVGVALLQISFPCCRRQMQQLPQTQAKLLVMAGRPKVREDLQLLAHIVPSAADEIFSNIEDGMSIREAAEAFGVCKRALSEWLSEPTRQEHYNRARTKAAESHVAEAMRIADRGADGEPDVQRDKLRVHVRLWNASRLDRETYGESKGPQVQINLASLHIDALRRYRAPEVATLPKCIEGIATESE